MRHPLRFQLCAFDLRRAAALSVLLLAAIFFSNARCVAADAPRAALDVFSGDWEGELRVFALDGFLLKTFSAQRHYQWDGNAQVVVTRFFDGSSDYETRAQQFVDDGRFTAVVARPGQAPEEYVGALEAGTVVWTNTSNNKRDYSERLVTVHGVTKLETSSSEIMRVKGVSGVVRVTGSFQRGATAGGPGSPASNAVSAAPTPTPAAVDARIAELEKQLADAQRTAAASTVETATTVRALQEQLQAATTARDQATAETANFKTELAALRADAEKLRAGATTEGTRTQQLERELASAQAARVQHESAARVLQTELEALRHRADSVETELTRAKTAEALAVEQLAQQRTENEVLDHRATEASSETARLSARVQELEATLTAAASADRTTRDANRESAELRERVSRLESELETERTARLAQEKGHAAASSALLATRGEAEKLAARVHQLEAAIASADGAQRETADTINALQRERAALYEELQKLATAMDAAKAQAAGLQAERDQLAKRVAELSARPEVSAEVLVAERREAREQLARAETAAREATVRLAETEKQLAASRATAARVDEAVADAAEVQRSLATAHAETAAARRQVELLESERDLLAFKLKNTDVALAERQSALETAEAAVVEARRRADRADARAQDLQAAGDAAATLRTELDGVRATVAQHDAEKSRLSARLGELERERATLEARVAELETAAKQAAADGPSFNLDAAAGSAATQREEQQAELTRLQRRVTELESERNSIRNTQTFLQGQLDQTRQLRDDTLARFQDVVAQLNTMREERDRLARANVSLQAELRTARGPGAAPPAAPVATSSPSFLDRLLGNTEAPKPAAPAAEPDEADAPPRASPVIEGKIAALQVIGITRAAEGDKVILNGRLYRSGDIIDPSAAIVFERIDGDALIFSDANGHEYRRRF